LNKLASYEAIIENNVSNMQPIPIEPMIFNWLPPSDNLNTENNSPLLSEEEMNLILNIGLNNGPIFEEQPLIHLDQNTPVLTSKNSRGRKPSGDMVRIQITREKWNCITKNGTIPFIKGIEPLNGINVKNNTYYYKKNWLITVHK
jgi:hypothetical protein